MLCSKYTSMSELVNYCLTLSYEGTAYSGFQIQENALTIQEVLETCLEKLFGQPIRVTAAGRTDAGAHARGQVIHYFASPRIPVERLPYALNGLLPKDIVVTGSCLEKDSFDARKNALGKHYRYTVDNGKFPDVFWRRYAWHLPVHLDLEAMRSAAALLVGEHDFKGFQAAGGCVETTVRRLQEVSIRREGQLIHFSLEGSGFLYKMVRNIVGTLVDVGRACKGSGDVLEIMRSRDRKKAGVTAPAWGLCLEEVFY